MLEQRVAALERVSDRQDQQIMTLNEKLNKIDENTTWIKRTITGAIVTAICTGVIGGAIAIMYNLFAKVRETDMKFADKGTVVRTVLLCLLY